MGHFPTGMLSGLTQAFLLLKNRGEEGQTGIS